MKQPQRLMNTGSAKARALLSSLDEDVPRDPIAGQERILRALEAAGAGSTDGRAREPAPLAGRRWLPLASIAGLVVACAVAWSISERRDASAPKPAPSTPESIAATVSTVVVPAAPVEPPASEEPMTRGIDVHALASARPVDSSGARASRANARRDPGSAPASNAAPSSTTADELQVLERAQAAASQGRSDEALALVAAHRRDFPQPRFGVEMSVVEIEALARAGRVDEAATRGERFLASHPGSPYTRRVEVVVRSRSQKEQSR